MVSFGGFPGFVPGRRNRPAGAGSRLRRPPGNVLPVNPNDNREVPVSLTKASLAAHDAIVAGA